eukprot:CAMPEP_0114487326 /NCGR_PEP_ID=MMETSP0109-20121206/705_1 /TAXON_ID=29199 /ORGANISM="Chlorarachnion reptans, Strain CCCM449" /LENGTH=202 /DNA_ID=CAMNT_0001663581 /DNA_START=120 /DNA_END=728 /DNA_ORIENTATION=+
MPKFGKAPACPRCSKPVYFAEQKLVLGKPWHKACFSCKECKRSLNAGFTDRDDEVYCPRCYGKLFGPKGYGFGGGAGVLSSEKGTEQKKVTKGPMKKMVKKKSPTHSSVPSGSGGAQICSKCERSLGPEIKFCTECGGKAIPKPKPAPKPTGPSCSKCGTGLKPGQKFCTECGARAEPAGCPKCNASIKEGQKFCTECGFKL